MVASASNFDRIIIWEIETGKQINSFIGYSEYDGLRGLSFSPNGKTLAYLFNGYIRMVDTNSGQERLLIRNSNLLLSRVAFSNSGNVFASTWDYGTVVLREVETGKILKTLPNPLKWMSHVVFSPDGNSIIEGDLYGDVIIWDIAPEE